MATYSTRNRLIKQANNENLNTWGTTFNAGMTDLVDEAMDGITALSMSGDVTLTNTDGATDQSRKRILNITSTGGANRTITIPALEKWYIVRNAGANYITIKTASGTGVIVPAACSALVACDALDCYRIGQSDYGLIQTYSYTGFSGSAMAIDLATGGFKNFKLKVKGYSATGAGGLGAQFSSNGVSYTTTLTLNSIAGAAETIYGELTFNALESTFGLDVKLANIAATNTGGAVTVTVPASAITAKDEGTNLTTALTSVDFVGAGVTA